MELELRNATMNREFMVLKITLLLCWHPSSWIENIEKNMKDENQTFIISGG